MITKELIDRINILARKQRSTGLTEEEKEEQQQLREQYLAGIRKQVIDQLEAVKKAQNNSCSCGCNNEHHHH